MAKKDNNQKCVYKRNAEEYKQQYLRQVSTHPIAYLAQTLPRVAQYMPENGAHAVGSQGYWQGRYICSEATCKKYISLPRAQILTSRTSLAQCRLAAPVLDNLQYKGRVHR